MSSRALTRHGRRALHLTAMLAAGLFALALSTAPAMAQGPWWHLESRAAPSNLPPGGEGQIIVSASNVGTAEANAGGGQPITLTGTLPAGLTATAIKGESSFPEELPMSCSLEALSCTYAKGVLPYKRLEVTITVKVAPGASSGEENTVRVEGGGAAVAPALSRPLRITSDRTPFAVENYELTPEEEGGLHDIQAGSHPFQLTATFDLNQTLAPHKSEKILFPGSPALARNLNFHLPPGLLGNPTAVPQCSDVDFSTLNPGVFTNLCPANTAVGVAVVTIAEPVFFPFITAAVPVFNLTPAQGEPARFGFEAFKVPVILDTAVRSSEGYGVVVSVSDATQAAAILGSQVTFWGAPGDASHDSARGWACLDLPPEPERGALKNCTAPSEHSSDAFLTLPTSCPGQPLVSTVEGVSWPTASAPEGEPLPPASALIQPLQGCDQLPFGPSVSIEPDRHTASTPTGMTVEVKVPQESTVSAGGLAEAAVKDTTIALPAGLQVSPSAATGLLACTGSQAGLEPGAEESLQAGNESFSEALPICPEQAKVATATIKTPLLDHELQGEVYLASQNTNPFAPPLVLYLLVHDPVTGVLVKLAGTVVPDPGTGQLTSTFANTPQLPFEELKLHFFDGPRASLSTPPLCGDYQAHASFTPWSGAAAKSTSSSFPVTSGPGGGGCPPAQPFTPTFNAQSTNTQAGAFTSFALNIGHPDGDQALSALSMHLPPGAAAMISSVTPCPEPQAALNLCGAESLIGHSTASSGLGPEPLALGGKVFLTGPYKGAPFGLSVVTPAVAGPFNLGDVTVRSKIEVDPSTAAVTVTSDPFPTIIKGVPVQLKQINVTIDRPGFQFNPTNCKEMAITGTLTGEQGTSASVSSRFQVGGCAALPFHPTLTASTKGDSSKANGASFTVKVTSSPGQANIAKTKLVLPIALPARLTTIQKACPAQTFEANPAACPEGSNIGSASAHTPVLKNPLSGPAYLVSHGNAAFPDVEFVLQGEGITLILDGQTDIKKGITTSTFNNVPDAPVTTFETTLPEGPHSALTANVPESKHFSLCGTKLSMPTTITGQNGAVIEQQTKIPVLGCNGVKAYSKSQLLAKALKKCRKQFKHARKKRAACEAKARKRYGAKHKRAGKRGQPKKK